MSLTLVFNAGSSSLKYQLFQGEDTLLKGTLEVGGHESTFAFHYQALDAVVKALEADGIKTQDISVVGHRFVHGGTQFRESVVVTESVFHKLAVIDHLAPLHNPKALDVIKGCYVYFQNTPQVAVFDTAFHSTIDEVTYTYPISRNISEKFGIRKYGFHGTSHKYVAEVAATQLRKPLEELNAITCHLGAGSSITAIQNGQSVDTSMGFTPLAGVMMGTRSGDIDPGIIVFLLEQGYGHDTIHELLNYESGLTAIAGTSDMREILEKSKSDSSAKLARDMYIQRVVNYIGAYLARVPGIEVIVFTGGIGENDQDLRNNIVSKLKHLSVGDTIKVLVVHTNEELAIARECWKVGTQ